MIPWYKSSGYSRANLVILAVCVSILLVIQTVEFFRKPCEDPLSSFGSCATSESCSSPQCLSMDCYGVLTCIPDVTEACYFGTMYLDPGRCPSYDTAWERSAKMFLSSLIGVTIFVFVVTRIVMFCRARSARSEDRDFLPDEVCPQCGGTGLEDGNTARVCTTCHGQDQLFSDTYSFETGEVIS